MQSRFSVAVLSWLLLVIPTVTFALSPLVQYNDLVAGEGDSGFADGSFYSAQFNGPMGLTLNPDGSILYVADNINNRIRAIDLNHKNNVSTVVGTGENGLVDGPFSIATFSHPRSLVYLPNDKIAVSEGNGGDSDIRLIDLRLKVVSTLIGKKYLTRNGMTVSLGDLWNLVYRPEDACLYFSAPVKGVMKRLHLKTGVIETILENNPLIPHPKALYVSTGNVLLVADRDLEKIYSVAGLELTKQEAMMTLPVIIPPVVESNEVVPIELEERGSAHKVIALAGTSTSVYAYEGEPVSQSPIVRISPSPDTLTFGSVWGVTMINASAVMPYFQGVDSSSPVGFLADPRSERRFYISNSFRSLIASFRDLGFGDLLGNTVVQNFSYPIQKPFQTYRILLCGRSALFFQEDENWAGGGLLNGTTNIMMLFGKKLELELNTQAALEDVPIHFEVIIDGRVSDSSDLSVWPYYEVPQVVKSLNIDQVIIMLDSANPWIFGTQYEASPITSEGIPSESFDDKFKLLTNSEKFKTGPYHDFYILCQKKKLLTIKDDTHWKWAPIDKLLSDSEVKESLINLDGKPLGLLKNKLDSYITSWGVPCRLDMCYFPAGSGFVNPPTKAARSIWKGVCSEFGLGFLDLTDDFLVTRLTYYPFSSCQPPSDHFSKDGHSLMAYLLEYELIKNKIIPWPRETDSSN